MVSSQKTREAHTTNDIRWSQSATHVSEFPHVTAEISRRYRERDGIDPYIISAGGTNAVGALGFVNAAVELAGQLRPDIIYLPMGTGGTLAGLLTGFLLTDFRPRIEAVCVVETGFRNETHIKSLCDELCGKLNLSGRVADEDIIIRDEFFGDGYGIPTTGSREAVRLFHTFKCMELKNTYTKKTVAALLHDLRTGELDGKTALYWNTLNARDLSVEISGINFRSLPPALHPYFEQPDSSTRSADSSSNR